MHLSEDEKFRRCIADYLRKCFRDESPPHVQEAAATMNISRSRFTRDFQRIYGTSPSFYFVAAQVERAEELIAEGLTVTQAAYAVGFQSRRSLYRAFKRVKGRTPKGRR